MFLNIKIFLIIKNTLKKKLVLTLLHLLYWYKSTVLCDIITHKTKLFSATEIYCSIPLSKRYLKSLFQDYVSIPPFFIWLFRSPCFSEFFGTYTIF